MSEDEVAALEAIQQRDDAEDWADRLAYAIAPMDVIGEHSSMNNPWQNALDYLDGEYEEFAGMAAARAALSGVPEGAATRCLCGGPWPCPDRNAPNYRMEAYAEHGPTALRSVPSPEPLDEVRRWLADPEWPRFGPGIGRGPLDPGRMAARGAVEQVIDHLAAPQPVPGGGR